MGRPSLRLALGHREGVGQALGVGAQPVVAPAHGQADQAGGDGDDHQRDQHLDEREAALRVPRSRCRHRRLLRPACCRRRTRTRRCRPSRRGSGIDRDGPRDRWTACPDSRASWPRPTSARRPGSWSDSGRCRAGRASACMMPAMSWRAATCRAWSGRSSTRGTIRAARMPMMTMTTMISIRVNPAGGLARALTDALYNSGLNSKTGIVDMKYDSNMWSARRRDRGGRWRHEGRGQAAAAPPCSTITAPASMPRSAMPGAISSPSRQADGGRRPR